MTAELNALADRLEQASEDEQHELLEEAFAALFSKPERVWVTDNTGPWTDEYEAYHERSWRFAGMLEAEAYESAALTLVPEGCAWGITTNPHNAAVPPRSPTTPRGRPTMTERYPNIWKLEHLYKHCTNGPQAGLPDGRYVPARPLGFCSFGQRIRAARLVFIGKADAVIWEGQ